MNCIYCGGPAGINTVDRPEGPLHYSRIECSEFLKSETKRLNLQLSEAWESKKRLRAEMQKDLDEKDRLNGELQKLIERVDDYFCNHPEVGMYDGRAVIVVPPDLAQAIRTVAEKRSVSSPKEMCCLAKARNEPCNCDGKCRCGAAVPAPGVPCAKCGLRG